MRRTCTNLKPSKVAAVAVAFDQQRETIARMENALGIGPDRSSPVLDTSPPELALRPSYDLTPEGVFLGQGWHALETFGGEVFGG